MTTDGWASRLATVDDADEIARLLHDFNVEYGAPTPGPAVIAARLRALLPGGSTFALLAGDASGSGRSGRSVGVGLVTLRPNVWYEGPVALLDELYVVPDLRSKGIGTGTGMIELLASTCHDRGVEVIEINVDEGDVDTQRFYERHGFSVIDPDTHERAFYFYRELTPG